MGQATLHLVFVIELRNGPVDACAIKAAVWCGLRQTLPDRCPCQCLGSHSAFQAGRTITTILYASSCRYRPSAPGHAASSVSMLSSVLRAFRLPAAGTGYGHGGREEHGPVWDSRKAEMMQAAHDADLQRLLRRLAELLFAALRDGGCGPPSAPGSPPLRQRYGPRYAAVTTAALMSW